MSGRLLLVDDDRDMCRLVAAGLGRRGFDVTWRVSADDALALVDTADLDAVITDLDLGGTTGIELCARLAARRPDVPVAVLTGFGDLQNATAALRAGAYDFLTKPADMDDLAAAMTRAVRQRVVRGELRRLTAPDRAPAVDGLLGESAAMHAVVDLVARVGDADASVLVVGETGTGKELVARAVHQGGRRRAGRFVAVNCAAIPEALIDSELFGHVGGAFTGARGDRRGLFARADGGTLFLDEIGELPLALQPKLLRAIQERTVRPVGADDEVPVDVRVVAATNRELDAACASGAFRADLLFRLDVVRIEIPPLRSRSGDVLLLARHFVARHAARAGKAITGLSPPVADALLAYPWPGNVRELENCIERAVWLARYDRLVVDDLPARLRRPGARTGTLPDMALTTLAEMERRHVERVLERVDGNRTEAARILGLDRKTLYRKLRRYAGCVPGEASRPTGQDAPADGGEDPTAV
jgi:two-component system response regulator HydG